MDLDRYVDLGNERSSHDPSAPWPRARNSRARENGATRDGMTSFYVAGPLVQINRTAHTQHRKSGDQPPRSKKMPGVLEIEEAGRMPALQNKRSGGSAGMTSLCWPYKESPAPGERMPGAMKSKRPASESGRYNSNQKVSRISGGRRRLERLCVFGR